MKFWKVLLLFYLGGMVYTALELLWRGYSHSSMFVLGGLCFVLIGQLGRRKPKLPLVARTVVVACIVTVLELGCGLLVNRDYHVWDYRQLPLNYRGQICLPFFLLWLPLTMVAAVLYERLETRLDNYAKNWT